jgi:hypothetical protein
MIAMIRSKGQCKLFPLAPRTHSSAMNASVWQSNPQTAVGRRWGAHGSVERAYVGGHGIPFSEGGG